MFLCSECTTNATKLFQASISPYHVAFNTTCEKVTQESATIGIVSSYMKCSSQITNRLFENRDASDDSRVRQISVRHAPEHTLRHSPCRPSARRMCRAYKTNRVDRPLPDGEEAVPLTIRRYSSRKSNVCGTSVYCAASQRMAPVIGRASALKSGYHTARYLDLLTVLVNIRHLLHLVRSR